MILDVHTPATRKFLTSLPLPEQQNPKQQRVIVILDAVVCLPDGWPILKGATDPP